MPNHPNRGASARLNPARNPTPAEIKAWRTAAGLTAAEAAALIYATPTTWDAMERGEKRCHPAFWLLARLRQRHRALIEELMGDL